MPNQTSATLRELPPLTVIDLGGEVTTFAEDAVNGAYKQASDQGAKHILLNFKDVEYINSAGISVIIGLLTEARKSDQTLMITGLTPHYTKIFQMMGLSQYAPLFDTEDAARQAAGA
ncbi:MAG TPA: STAS domain-containing protein [Chloroflexota bacterium]|nr:STAS domain-containing protein [Chloroflexota bacterium]